ncbi:MAG: hypothetical protein IJI37_01000 [Opitutales bacterium]|nr:hypothetical protein [Opitutales bacterium]
MKIFIDYSISNTMVRCVILKKWYRVINGEVFDAAKIMMIPASPRRAGESPRASFLRWRGGVGDKDFCGVRGELAVFSVRWGGVGGVFGRGVTKKAFGVPESLFEFYFCLGLLRGAGELFLFGIT